MSDAVQEFLLAVQRGEGGPVVSDGYDALAREWRPRVRRFLASPSEGEVDDWLSAAIMALVVELRDGQPRALAPADALPRAWRRRVLQHFLIDEARKRGLRRNAENTLREGGDALDAARRWEERKATAPPTGVAPCAEDASVTAPLGAPLPAEAAAADHPREMDRRAIWSVLDQLAPMRAVILVLALRGDPRPLAGALAAHLGEPVARVRGRMEYALWAPPDHAHDLLTMAMVRVVKPDGDDAKALDTARKALARALADVRSHLRSRAAGGDR